MNTRLRPLPWLIATSLLATGCANMGERERGTAAGAGIGAAAGAIISTTTGGKAGSGALIGGVLGAAAGNLWSKRMEDKRKAMEKATAGTGVTVDRTADNQLKVNVPSDISFDTGRSDIRAELRPVLDQFAQGLDATMHVRVVGHTDSTGSDAVNDPLSVERARSVREYLASKGVASQRVEISGEGARQPIADNGTADGRSRNRRVEIFLREPQKPS
ncbi:MAG: OmpA family protein [Vitreoscilla sp.]|nr:OmpA family protein [Vitreoscilla sp.]